jgi:hypothetical protein
MVTSAPMQVSGRGINTTGKTVLCRVLFIGALGKIKHSAKVALPSARHSAKVPLGKRWAARDGGHLPSDFAECMTDGTRQFFLFLKTYFAECQLWALGNFFLKFLKTYFAECQRQALGNFFYYF